MLAQATNYQSLRTRSIRRSKAVFVYDRDKAFTGWAKLLWTRTDSPKRFGGYDYCYGVTATTGGGYLLVGHSTSGGSGDKSEASRGGDDFWAVKIDADGKK